MDTKFFDSLYEGDSANGFKLCMGLTGGDFWARASGGYGNKACWDKGLLGTRFLPNFLALVRLGYLLSVIPTQYTRAYRTKKRLDPRPQFPGDKRSRGLSSKLVIGGQAARALGRKEAQGKAKKKRKEEGKGLLPVFLCASWRLCDFASGLSLFDSGLARLGIRIGG